MEINCFYDEDMEYADIVYIPETILDIEELQNDFFRWLFDKKMSTNIGLLSMEKRKCANMELRHL